MLWLCYDFARHFPPSLPRSPSTHSYVIFPVGDDPVDATITLSLEDRQFPHQQRRGEEGGEGGEGGESSGGGEGGDKARQYDDAALGFRVYGVPGMDYEAFDSPDVFLTEQCLTASVGPVGDRSITLHGLPLDPTYVYIIVPHSDALAADDEVSGAGEGKEIEIGVVVPLPQVGPIGARFRLSVMSKKPVHLEDCGDPELQIYEGEDDDSDGEGDDE